MHGISVLDAVSGILVFLLLSGPGHAHIKEGRINPSGSSDMASLVKRLPRIYIYPNSPVSLISLPDDHG